MKKSNRKRMGFTLIETVIALVLIAMIAGYTFSSLSNTNKTIMRGKRYSESLYKVLADVNRGQPIDERSSRTIRITTVTEEDGLIIVESYIKTNMDKGSPPIEVKVVRYKRGRP